MTSPPDAGELLFRYTYAYALLRSALLTHGAEHEKLLAEADSMVRLGEPPSPVIMPPVGPSPVLDIKTGERVRLAASSGVRPGDYWPCRRCSAPVTWQPSQRGNGREGYWIDQAGHTHCEAGGAVHDGEA